MAKSVTCECGKTRCNCDVLLDAISDVEFKAFTENVIQAIAKNNQADKTTVKNYKSNNNG